MPVVARKPRLKGYKTWIAKPGEIKQKWYLVDAEKKSLGRISTRIAERLMGKDKPTWTPHTDTGDFVVVVNAEKVSLDTRKTNAKTYARVSGYLGGRRVETLGEVLEKHPTRVVEHAVRLMLPKTLLGKRMFSKLKVYAGTEHPHAAQKPEPWNPLAKAK